MIYDENIPFQEMSGRDIVLALLREEAQPVKTLQAAVGCKSRSQFLKDIINPLINEGIIIRSGKPKSPASRLKLKT